MNKTVILLNQGMTVFMLCLAFFLLVEWWPGTWRGIKSIVARAPATPACWLMVAITVSHIAMVTDNLYWLVAWSAIYIDSPLGQKMIDSGVYFNTIFRQGFGTLGVYLHIHAAKQNVGSFVHFKGSAVRWMFIIALAIGTTFSTLLLMMRG